MLLSALQSDTLEPKGLDLQTLTPERSFHIGIHPEFVVLVLGIAGADRWMVAHLL